MIDNDKVLVLIYLSLSIS